jgi:hypothetical protein
MNDEGESIIEEYLVLVREKLPDSIANDVISELRSYMHESARDQGEGEITVQSAKKVVARFGAPGEVANEYKYSMLPETMPMDTIPSDTLQEPDQISQQEPMLQEQRHLTSITQADPTIGYNSFFSKTSLQTWIWILIASLFTLVVGPIGVPLWTLGIPISQAAIVTCVLFLQTLNLKWNKTILWRRAYREWSAFQNYVTLPENAIPEAGVDMLRLDSLTSFVGIVIFLIASLLGNSPLFLMFSGVPVVILLGARIYYRVVTFRDDGDPIRNSRKQFVVNLALLIGINASAFWIFSDLWPYWFILPNFSPILLPFMLGYGSILLFNIVTGAQNLWWTVQDEPKTNTVKEKKIPAMENRILTTEKKTPVVDKTALLERLPGTMSKLYIVIAGWIVIYNLPQIYVSFDHASFDYVTNEFYSWVNFLIIEIAIISLLIVLYLPYRRFAIKRFDSRTIFGQRTRGEAIVDALISTIFLGMILLFIFGNGFNNIIINSITDYQRHLGVRWSIILATMEISVYPLGAIALIIRIIGDFHEFEPVWKKRAIGLIEQSGVLLLLAITALIGVQYLKWIVIYRWFSSFFMFYIIFLVPVLFLAFQVGSSSLKGKIMRETDPKKRGDSVNSHDVYSSIAN